MRTITRGDPDKAQEEIAMDLYRISAFGRQEEKARGIVIAIKEPLWVQAYTNLVAFISDFQKNRQIKQGYASTVQRLEPHPGP